MEFFNQIRNAFGKKKSHLKTQCKNKLYTLLCKLYSPILSELRKPIGGGGLEMLIRKEINSVPPSFFQESKSNDSNNLYPKNTHEHQKTYILKYGETQGFAQTLSLHETLEHLLQTQSIFLRLGDGEFPIFKNHNGGFHLFTQELKDKLLSAYYFALNNQDFTIGILRDFIYPFTHPRDSILINSCKHQIMDFLNFFPLRNYADAMLLRTPPLHFYAEKHFLSNFQEVLFQSFDPNFYHHNPLGKKIFNYYKESLITPIKSLWENCHLIICEGEFSHFGIHNDLLDNALSIQRVQSKNFNAFSCYEEILQNALKKTQKFPKEEVFFICALGHTSKILLVDLYKKGYKKGIDAGNFSIAYDSFLHSFPYTWVDSPVQKSIYPPLQYGINLPIYSD